MEKFKETINSYKKGLKVAQDYYEENKLTILKNIEHEVDDSDDISVATIYEKDGEYFAEFNIFTYQGYANGFFEVKIPTELLENL